jgi:rare lipoprotein A
MRRATAWLAAAALAGSFAGCTDGPQPRPATTPGRPDVRPASPASRPIDAELMKIPEPVPKNEPLAAQGNPPFYDVYGTRYTVMRDARGYIERGVASWYGPDFHGLKTSTGEPYDMYGLTGAHKTLPLPCYVEVVNLANGRSVVVRVNDRGPFKANRIIDLSYTAALRLGMLQAGTALVEVRVLEPGGQVPRPAPPTQIYAQTGAFAAIDNARRLKARLEAAGFAGVSVYRAGQRGNPLYRVRVGPIADAAAFDALVERLQTEGIGHAWLSTPRDEELAVP